MRALLRSVVLTLLASFALSPRVASATLNFHGAVQPGAESNKIPFDPILVSDDSPVYVEKALDDPNHGELSGAASASFGHVGAFAFARSFNDSVNVQTRAVFADDQLIFHADDPSAFPSGMVPVSLNLVISGLASINHDGTGQVNLALYASINGGLVGTMQRAVYDIGPNHYDQCSGTLPGDCHLASYTTVTQEVSVALDTPVSLQLDLNVAAGVFGSLGFTTPTATGDYLHSIDLPVGSDVFNLPAGVTVNEPDAFIINNRFAPPVPEPAPITMFVMGMFTICARRRGLNVP